MAGQKNEQGTRERKREREKIERGAGGVNNQNMKV